MKRLSTLSVLLLAMTIIASTGCARWTLLPKRSNTPTAPTANGQANPPSSLMQAAAESHSPQSSPQQAANQPNPQATGEDLKTLEPALAIARLTERQGEPDDARRQYLRYIEKHPQHPLPHHRLGVMAAREAKFEEAEGHFQAAARLAPPTAELLSDFGYLRYLQSRLPEAEQLMQQASQMEPSNQTIVNNLALVLGAKGQFDESMRNFRRVNEEAEARANLAYTLSQHGELDHARKEYLHALTLDNKLGNAAKALVQVEEARKREQLAIARQKEALGDEVLQRQPQGGQPAVEARPMQRMPTLELSQQTAPSVRPTTVTSRPVAEQPAAAYQPTQRPRSNMLMPIPSPTREVASRPTPRRVEAAQWQESYPVTEVQAARPVEQASHVQPASHVEPVEAALSTPSFARSQTQPVETPKPLEADWGSAWQQMSQGSQQPAATPPASEPRKGGYSISLGDK